MVHAGQVLCFCCTENALLKGAGLRGFNLVVNTDFHCNPRSWGEGDTIHPAMTGPC